MVCGSYLTDARDTMQVTELYRTGGYKSVRGYTDNEFPFKTVLYEQLEGLYYFSYTGSIYIFIDAGAGFGAPSAVSVSSAVKMLGYGVGIRMPVKIGDASFEWARNYKDTQSWGRIHLSLRNSVSSGMTK
jgi:outer membrane protein assembly factor BamA